MEKLSVVIITLNEEKNIQRCLDSVITVADEIVVVDSFSTDSTEQICHSYGVKFFKHKFKDYVNQKNYANSKASYDYILSLDADEVLSEELKESVLNAKAEFDADGYTMNRLTNYVGSWVHHCGWYPDRKLRLFNRRKGSWEGIIIHEKFNLYEEGKQKYLKGNLLHFSFHSVEEHLKQTEKFTTLGAEADFIKGKKVSVLKLIFGPGIKFIRDFFINLGFLDGSVGFRICYISAYATYLKYHKLRNMVKSIILSRTDSLGDVILTLPIAGAIKRQNPDIKIFFLGRNYSKSLIETSEYVDEFLNFDTISRMTKNDQVSFIKKLNVDAIIHVFPNKKIAQLAKKAGVSIRIGTSHRLFHLYTCNRIIALGRKNSNLHEAQLNLRLLSSLRVRYDYKLSEIPSLYGYNNFVELNENLNKLLSIKRKNIILHPKSKGSAREWGMQNFSRLIEILPIDKYKIFITGTREEGSLMMDFLKAHKKRVIDLTGQLSLDELISFISKVDALVATSTGPLHIAAATGINAVGIFAPMRPIHPGRWKPLGKNANYLVLDKDCNSCKRGGVCECIRDISVDQVYKKLLD